MYLDRFHFLFFSPYQTLYLNLPLLAHVAGFFLWMYYTVFFPSTSSLLLSVRLLQAPQRETAPLTSKHLSIPLPRLLLNLNPFYSCWQQLWRECEWYPRDWCYSRVPAQSSWLCEPAGLETWGVTAAGGVPLGIQYGPGCFLIMAILSVRTALHRASVGWVVWLECDAGNP